MFFKSRINSTQQHQFIERLKAAPVVQEAMREIEGQELAERQALVDEAKALEKKISTFAAMRCKREAEIAAEMAALGQRRSELEAELESLGAAGTQVHSTAGQERATLVALIKAGADPRINNFTLWAQTAYSQAVNETWKSGSYNKAFVVGIGTEARVARDAQMQLESVGRLARLVTESCSRADAMRLEASLADDVMLELRSLAAEIHGEYMSVPRSQLLATDFLARIPGVMVLEMNDVDGVVP